MEAGKDDFSDSSYKKKYIFCCLWNYQVDNPENNWLCYRNADVSFSAVVDITTKQSNYFPSLFYHQNKITN